MPTAPSMTTRPQLDQPLDWSALADRLRRVARALAGPRRPELADDLVQDAVARLLARESSPPTYPYARAALVRIYLDHERAARRRAARAVRWALMRPSSHIDEAAGDRSAALHGALERLSPTQRAVLVLRLVEDLPTDAVAEALETSPRVVRASLHTARARMRDQLRKGAEP